MTLPIETGANRKGALSSLAPLALSVAAHGFTADVPDEKQSNDGPHTSDVTPNGEGVL